ncbi:DUF6377 domain-containing protein [Sphingobacterium sp. LRF_L2]|uniref:DUF6377 domain-containing protein n=1 Tax=Sphingobacterium sp. LRF_L2 TaxID=3369421 RepID=UPI003F60D1DD
MLISIRFIILFLSLGIVRFAQAGPDSVLRELSQVLLNQESFERVKLLRIEQTKDLFFKETVMTKKLELAFQLSNEYRKYQIDSAIKYTQLYLKMGLGAQNEFVVDKASIYLAILYSSAGKFIESEQLLRGIRRDRLSTDLLPAYFEAYTAFSSHYGQSSDNQLYFKRSEVYRDSLLLILDKESLSYDIALATKLLYGNRSDEAEEILQRLLSSTTDEQVDRAVIAYLMGVIYKNKGDIEKQLYYFGISAIVDRKYVVKDNASLQSLAQCYYSKGDIDKAYLFIQEAVNDAVFCNVRYRSLENSSFYSIINAAFQDKELAQKRVLRQNLLVISVLTMLLLVVLFLLYFQLKKLRLARAELHHANDELKDLNQLLLHANSNLSESNHIKEEYIAQFFDICSSYIDKIDEQRKSLLKKFTLKQFEEINKILKSQDLVKNELDELYHNFDIIFLNLYPSFIEDFNSLLRTEEAIILKSGELLNTELRIFALIRLGITDSTKIASFLRYSLCTVYNYRVKVRGKVAGSKDEFEESIRNIGNIRSL